MQMQLVSDFLVRTLSDEMLTSEQLHTQGERLMEALLDLEGCNPQMSTPATASDAKNGVVTVELLMEASEASEAVRLADAITRTAIHAIGGATPDWDALRTSATRFEPQNVQVEYV